MIVIINDCISSPEKLTKKKSNSLPRVLIPIGRTLFHHPNFLQRVPENYDKKSFPSFFITLVTESE